MSFSTEIMIINITNLVTILNIGHIVFQLHNFFAAPNDKTVLSGMKRCPPQAECAFSNKDCHGNFVDHGGNVETAEECLELCKENPKCYWANFNSFGYRKCNLVSDCKYLTKCYGCFTQRRDCGKCSKEEGVKEKEVLYKGKIIYFTRIKNLGLV